MDLIDLHCHSTASDGTLTPSKLIDLARESGLKALALTDHDTLEGLPEAIERSQAIGMELVPGVEISAEFKPGSMHILGYFVDYNHGGLAGKLKALQDSRKNRNPKIIANLNKLGFDVTLDEVKAASGGGQVGRPHFAKVMIDKGYVRNMDEAFDRYLAKGKPGYAEKFRFSPHDAVELIRAAGGIPVLAHPFTLGLSNPDIRKLLAEMKESGLIGLEVYYSEHSRQMVSEYLGMAAFFDLTPTGGSDFHGANKPEIKLGRGFGSLKIPYSVLEDLKKRRDELL